MPPSPQATNSRGREAREPSLVADSQPAAAVLSSSLDDLETNPWNSPCWSRSEVRFHQRDWKSRRTIIRALDHRGTIDLAKRALRIWGCCAIPRILMDPHGLPILQPGWCRDRLCPTCAARRAYRSKGQLLKITQSMNSVRFLTLTLRSSPRTLAAAVDHLDKSFKRLRSSRIWSEHVKGGVAVLEVTWRADTRRWHPHLHVLVDGSFFPHSQLKSAWLEASGDSFIVDIRVVHDRAAAAG